MPHIEISLAWSPGIRPDFSPEAVNNDLPPHPCNRDFCIREERGKKRENKTRILRERQAGPESPAWLAVHWVPGIKVERAEVPLASRPLQQKSEDKEREQAYNILGL